MNLWGDLKEAKWMYLKAGLFLLAGIVAAAALLIQNLSLQTAFLIFVAIWSFCRLYYFFFYVIEKYIDPGHRFDGIGSAVRYLLKKR